VSERCLACDAALESGPSRCGACGAEVVRALVQPDVARPYAEAPPPRLHVAEAATFLSMRWRWFTWRSLGNLALALAWEGAVVAVFLGATPGLSRGGNPMMAAIFLASLPAVYVGLARTLNGTQLAVGRHFLEVRHGPLPFERAVEVRVEGLGGFEVTEQRGRNVARTFSLVGLTKDGRRRVLVAGLPSEPEAHFLAGKLGAFLRLPAVEPRALR
jgi:hypothetical protein